MVAPFSAEVWELAACYNDETDVADNILDIDALTDEQEQVLNSISVEYGMQGMDYSEYVSTALCVYLAWIYFSIAESVLL